MGTPKAMAIHKQLPIGFEFIEALKADTTLPRIPVIFLTTMEEGDHRGKELGAEQEIQPANADQRPERAHDAHRERRRLSATACAVASVLLPDPVVVWVLLPERRF